MSTETSPIILRNPNNARYTKQLFYETWTSLPQELRVTVKPPFCLYGKRAGFISFGKSYVDLGDPTGYKITQLYLDGDYDHWCMLLKCTWFKEAKETWDRELDAKLASEGLETIRAIAKDDEDKRSLTAARFLANKEYKEKTRAGRPTKAQVAGAIAQEARESSAVEDDMKRILRSVN